MQMEQSTLSNIVQGKNFLLKIIVSLNKIPTSKSSIDMLENRFWYGIPTLNLNKGNLHAN